MTTPIDDPFDALDRARRPWWTYALVVLVLAGLSVAIALRLRRQRRPDAPRYITGTVSVGNVVEVIEATGTVQPLVQVQVGSSVSARVLRVLVDYNAHVREGDLLAELDPAPFQIRVTEARAALAAADAQRRRARIELVLQERNLARASDLRARNLNSVAEVDTATSARDGARAQLALADAEIARARAQLDTAQTNRTYTRIVSPCEGIVITRSIEPGQTVAASLQSPTLFVIANDLTHMRVIADVDEADIGKLHETMVAEARVDAFPGEIFRGTVTALRYGPSTTQGVVTYPAVVDIPNADLKLRPGMTATLRITTARRDHVLRVPNAALRFRPAQAQASAPPNPRGDADDAGPHRGRVYVTRGHRAVAVPVHTGISDGSFTEIEAPEVHEGTVLITDEIEDAHGASSPGGAGGGNRQRSRLF